MRPAMQTAANLMPIPGHIDPVPVPRSFVPRSDGRIDLLGLSLAEAEAALTTMAGGGHSRADVDLDTGQLHFVIASHNDPRP